MSAKNIEPLYSLIRPEMDTLISRQEELFCRFDGSSVLITGASGLIGSWLVCLLLRANEQLGIKCRVLAMVRTPDKLLSKLPAGRIDKDDLQILRGDVCEPWDMIPYTDYLIHTACATSSLSFVRTPVETILGSIEGTKNALTYAFRAGCKGVVYLSSMEVYGLPEKGERITEKHGTNLDTTAVRSSYPESKRLCESLCSAYCHEHSVPVKIIRLTQTIGPGISYDDGRVFAEFARCVVEDRDIVLHTEGLTERSYLYISDAAAAILRVLLDGRDGEAYNAADESSLCSIREMARLVSEQTADGRISVSVEPDNTDRGYAGTLFMDLDTTRLRSLGWEPEVTLADAYGRLTDYMRAIRP